MARSDSTHLVKSKRLGTAGVRELSVAPPERHFYDVFLSYRHADAGRVAEDTALQGFLRRNGVRERRIDDVENALIWLTHLAEEGWANPTHVGVGIAEGSTDQTARLCIAWGAKAMAEGFYASKAWLDEARVSALASVRNAWADDLIALGYAQQRQAAHAIAVRPGFEERRATPATPPVARAGEPGEPWGLTLLRQASATALVVTAGGTGAERAPTSG